MRIGIDLVFVKRFENKTQSFFKKYFLESELKHAKSKPCFEKSIAGIFACKEAFLKALDLGLFAGIDLKQIEVCFKENGAPFLIVEKQIAKNFKIKKTSVSISHDGDYATAVCLIN